MMVDVERAPRRVEAIAIGVSAGGIEALSIVLPALAAGAGLSAFVVLHLPRGEPSLLVEIFGPKCRMAVREAEDKEPVAVDTVYFAPSDYHLLIDPGPQLSLSVDDPVNYSRPSIDVLFESAADIYKDRLMGIILTGANADGARGLAAVQRGGGITVVEDPATAQVSLMPVSALRRVVADFVLPLEGIAGLLRSQAYGSRP